ncbi:MAG: FapA family protein [Spirochaetota bacterium]|nr:FapA family protein [Spirochaetota bacterium]
MKIVIFYIDPKVTRMFVEKTDEQGNKSLALSSPNNFVYRNENIAKVVEGDDIEDATIHIDNEYSFHTIVKLVTLKSGEGIYFDEKSKIYKTSDYGFSIFDKNSSTISLFQPLQIPKDKSKAYYIVHPTKFRKIPTNRDIEETLVKKNIFSIVEKNLIIDQLTKIDVNEPKITRILVASGRDPIDGCHEYFIPLIEMERKAGKVLEDGSMDFREINSIIEVRKGQKILEKIPAIEPEDGFNIYGDKIEATFLENKGYDRGSNIVQSGSDKSIYVSSIDGCLEITKRRVSVKPVALIKGDVDYDTGNIDFNGSVHIFGSVLPGFSVIAKDNIIIDGHVDDAIIDAGGDIQVKLGIGGKGLTEIKAGGGVKAKYILNSTIQAVGEIEIVDSIINSNVSSNDKITVTDKHGKIIGGEAVALHEIIVNESGVPKENKTILNVGKSIYERDVKEKKRKMDMMKYNIEEVREYIKSIFGEKLFNDPKVFISNLIPVRRKSCLLLLSKITDYNKELKLLTEDYNSSKEMTQLKREPMVHILNKIYPGTQVNINNCVKLIEKVLTNVKFYEDKDERIIRFTNIV